MAKRGQYKARPGFERLPGRARLYRDLRTGETITKRQYTKRSEGVRSLEAKRDILAAQRQKTGKPHPMARYNALVKEYKSQHPNTKVRGPGTEFRELYTQLKNSKQIHNIHTAGGKRERKRHLRILYRLGVINKAEFERYINNE